MTMTEQEFMASTDPAAMLHHLTGTGRYGAIQIVAPTPVGISDRKLRLWACACLAACDQTKLLADPSHKYDYGLDGERIDSGKLQSVVASWAGDLRHYDPNPAVKAALLREIIGNPFKPVTLPEGKRICTSCNGKGKWYAAGGFCCPCDGRGWFADVCPWLTWNDGTVPRIAQTIYEERAFDQLPILADALEEAGTEGELVEHLRGKKRCPDCLGSGKISRRVYTSSWTKERQTATCERCHGSEWIPKRSPCVRGCWCVDLLTGRS